MAETQATKDRRDKDSMTLGRISLIDKHRRQCGRRRGKRHFGCKQRIRSAVNDRIGIEPEGRCIRRRAPLPGSSTTRERPDIRAPVFRDPAPCSLIKRGHWRFRTHGYFRGSFGVRWCVALGSIGTVGSSLKPGRLPAISRQSDFPADRVFEAADISLCSGLQFCSPPRSFLPLLAAEAFTSEPAIARRRRCKFGIEALCSTAHGSPFPRFGFYVAAGWRPSRATAMASAVFASTTAGGSVLLAMETHATSRGWTTTEESRSKCCHGGSIHPRCHAGSEAAVPRRQVIHSQRYGRNRI